MTTESFFKSIETAFKQGLPFVVYHFPGSHEIKAFIQNDTQINLAKNYEEPGFVFAPFNADEESILFPSSKSERIYCPAAKLKAGQITPEIEFERPSLNDKKRHIDLVEKAKAFMDESFVKKIVLSRKEMIACENIEILRGFKELLIQYHQAMCYLWFHPQVGTWMGASPELLLKVRDENFETMSLAGTQLHKGDIEHIWEAKEREEQKMVTDYLIKTLSGHTDIILDGPRTVKAGSLAHLCTGLRGKISNDFTLFNLITLLHPTPAVCGIPKDQAKDFILKSENYKREFYTGFFGEINLKEGSALYVNLRCMQVLKGSLAVYVGGGIIAESKAENEWEETVHKSKVILKALG